MIEMAAEIGDGLIGHPVWSVPWATETVPGHVARGLTRAGRKRSDLHVCLAFYATPNYDRKQSIEDARGCTAFYAGVEQYEKYYVAHGYGAEAKAMQEGVKRQDYQGVASLVSDEMASTFVLTGTPEEVRAKIEPAWRFADSIAILPPVLTLTPEKSAAYFETIIEKVCM